MASAQEQQPVPVKTQPARSRSAPYKDPELATVVGVLVPGGGQLYAGRYGKGLGLFAASAVGVALALDSRHSNRCSVGISCSSDALKAGGIVIAALGWGFGWATAARDARKQNSQMLNNARSWVPFLERRDGRLLAGLALATR
ncbi:MAG TPA: hypothetical protein VGH98_19080 [Gemmatimonadaceae bacterium]